ncbi:hypothetical protein M0R45_034949 [Rubus argutus]|uniref:Uncharacterized protein n=1 Tax=Rubus argutus TaxID=59490 RepID=A0AAW1VVE5_RUBAR
MKNYTIYAVSITIRIVSSYLVSHINLYLPLGFMLLAVFWKFDFPPFMVLAIAVLNDGTIIYLSKDKVKPSPVPDSWKLSEIFVTGVALASYLALMTIIFFWAAYEIDFFHQHFCVENFNQHKFNMSNLSISTPLKEMLSSALYLQISTISQALIFVTRSRGWSFTERPGLLLVVAFVITQLLLQEENFAEESKRRAEIARLRELHTLKGKVESFTKLKGLDIDAINQNYTV